MKSTDLNHIDVKMWDHLVGKLAIDNNGIGYFKYSDDFVKLGIEPAPITMPVKKGVTYSFPRLNTETFKGLPGMISDSLPDAYGDRLLDIHFKNIGIKDDINKELLKLCYINEKATGALEYTPPFNSKKGSKKESILF